MVECRVGPIWLQLGGESAEGSAAQVGTRFGVRDVRQQGARLEAMGVKAGPLEHVPGAVDYVDFTDPDGNVLSFYSELDQTPSPWSERAHPERRCARRGLKGWRTP